MTKRAVYVYAFMMFLLVIAALGTVTASMGNSSYMEAAGAQSMYTLQAAVSRGTIYDRNLLPLTNAEQKYIAAVIPSAETMARVNAITNEEQREELYTAMKNDKPFLINVNSPISTNGIQTFTVMERYSDPQPAANLIGYLQNGTTGVSGVEKSFDKQLSAGQGSIRVTFSVNAVGHAIHTGDLQVENTYRNTNAGIVLTIDKEVQKMLEQCCADIHKGAAVVLESTTGQILAMASFPALDPNHLAAALEDPSSPFINRALSAYTPGSIFKLISAAAALEYGADYRQTYGCTGALNIDGMDFACYDHIAHGEVNMHTAIRQSCNGYFVHLVDEIGSETVLEMAETLGIGEKIELAEGLSASTGTLPSSDTLRSKRAEANFSFGQGEITLTPLHAAAYINAIAMGGEYIVPQLYYGTADENLNVDGIPKLESRKVMEETTANRLRAYMESTARFGTAKVGAPKNCIAGIKTGTAQTGVFDVNGEEIMNYWYAGYLCGDEGDPKYTLVILEESAEPSHVPISFKKFAETLADFI